MKRATILVVAIALAVMCVPRFTSSVRAQTDMGGEWEISFASPQGPLDFTMYVIQQGPRLSGRLTSEYGEFPLRGTIDGSAFTMTWTFPDQGKSVEVTFAGTVEGDSLSGTAKLGTRGAGALSGRRTGQ